MAQYARGVPSPAFGLDRLYRRPRHRPERRRRPARRWLQPMKMAAAEGIVVPTRAPPSRSRSFGSCLGTDGKFSRPSSSRFPASPSFSVAQLLSLPPPRASRISRSAYGDAAQLGSTFTAKYGDASQKFDFRSPRADVGPLSGPSAMTAPGLPVGSGACGPPAAKGLSNKLLLPCLRHPSPALPAASWLIFTEMGRQSGYCRPNLMLLVWRSSAPGSFSTMLI